MDLQEILTLVDQMDKTTIGTQKEKILHRTLKYLISDNPKHHEIKLGPFYVDVMIDNHIYEIQTQSFNAFADKIKKLLDTYQITIVYPLCVRKKIIYLNEKNEPSSPRCSPRIGKPLEFFGEAYKIKHLLKHPNLSFKIIMFEGIIYKRELPKTESRYQKTIKLEMVPTRFLETIDLPEEYNKLLPKLPQTFTSADLKKACPIPQRKLQCAMNVLYYLDYFKRVGKKNRFYLYELNKERLNDNTN